MKTIPVRQINAAQTEPGFSGNFSIRDLEDLLAGKSMVQELHRHDYFYILALEKGGGDHEIDFTSYKVCDNSIFFMRPGHVHQLRLLSGSKGYLIQFKSDYYYPKDKASEQLLRKASNKNLCKLNVNKFKKVLTVLNNIFQEYTYKQERILD